VRDQDLLALDEKEMRNVRGHKISMIFQDPMTSLNPSIPIGKQIEESLIIHLKMSREKAGARVCELLDLFQSRILTFQGSDFLTNSVAG